MFRYGGGASKTFGSVQENVETWRCVHTLRGHSGGMSVSSSHFVWMRILLIFLCITIDLGHGQAVNIFSECMYNKLL